MDQDIAVDLPLTIEELYHGNITKTIAYERYKACSYDHSDYKTCRQCAGTGINLCGPGAERIICQKCLGSLREYSGSRRPSCPICQGQELLLTKESIDVKIPRGTRPDDVITLHGAGHERVSRASGKSKSNLLVRVTALPDPCLSVAPDSSGLVYKLYSSTSATTVASTSTSAGVTDEVVALGGLYNRDGLSRGQVHFKKNL